MTKATVHAPLAFQLFALEHPDEVKVGGQATLVLTAYEVKTMREVNLRVNAGIKPRLDSQGDKWTIWPTSGYGDCDDYVVTKRHELIKAKLSPSALRMVYCTTAAGEGHAVLLLKTSKDDLDLVLDNRTSKILHPKDTGYHFISMSTKDPSVWVAW